MKAKIIPGYNKNRQRLADLIPLTTPFTLHIADTHYCNFKCNYCTHSKSEEEKSKIDFKKVHMSMKMIEAIAAQASEFPQKFKRILFTGLGEPLMNANIPDMIRILNKADVAEGYEIITNGYLLTHEMTDKLLEAGLTYLRVSIQGVTAQRYKEITGVKIDYNRLVDNLTYFYEKRGNCKLYIKIIDACLEKEEDEQYFFKLFGNICDHIYIEHLTTAQPSMMDAYSEEINSKKTFYGDQAHEREVCPFAFYTLQVDAIGNVFPCPPLGFPKSFALGNINEISLLKIWTSRKMVDFQCRHLSKKRREINICNECKNYLCFTPEEDNLDNDAEKILKRMEEN